MSSARLLELYPRWPTGGVSVPFMAKYLFDRTMADQTNSSNFPSIIHGTVKRLMEYEQPKESGTNEKRQRDYIQMLCHLAASAVEWSYRDHWTLIENLIPNSIVVDENEADVNNVPRHTLAAASYIGKDELVTQLLSNENIDLHGNTYKVEPPSVLPKAGTTRFCRASYLPQRSTSTPACISHPLV